MRDGVDVPVAGDLAFDPAVLDFGSSISELTFHITNTGGAPADWEIAVFYDADDNPAPVPGGDGGALYMLDGYPYSGTLAPGAGVTTGLGLDRDALLADGQYQVTLGFSIGGVAYYGPPVRFTRLPEAPAVTGPTVVEASVAVNGQWLRSGSQESSELLTSYDFRATPGMTIVGAWIDVNLTGDIDNGDYVGFYDRLVQVEAGRSYTLPIEVSPYFEGGGAGWPEEWLDALRRGDETE